MIITITKNGYHKMKYCLFFIYQYYSCMPIILGGSMLNSGKCFVIDYETQTNQNTLAPFWLKSLITSTSLHFAVFANCQRPF